MDPSLRGAGEPALEPVDLDEALNAAAVGDDRMQSQGGSEVNPETWTHGSARDRSQWFSTGYESGNMDFCDTFGGQ